ncbi:hypothetical protein ACFQ3R_11520 [Mesonia ostreae]|uniref:Uncharacterized protein n=1 Tax=Mesonia ostreae TaxID=861110 RepID=A0ABU2KM92_9FLAO|nr:hypothetical protein [Mesonia ostreae]MDT0295828.1 hypothetical protein [Mesonia ostreae]
MKKNEKNLLIWLLILAIVFIVLIKFVLADITEILDKGSEFGEIIYNLSLAYISSYIFYQIVVAIPQKRNEKNIHESTSFISYGIIHSGSRIVKPKNHRKPIWILLIQQMKLVSLNLKTFVNQLVYMIHLTSNGLKAKSVKSLTWSILKKQERK